MAEQHWKLKKSRITDVVPKVYQIDEDTLAFNQRDGKLYAIKVADGVKTVIQIGGDNHTRKHNIINPEDHLVDAKPGQIIVADTNSTIKFFDLIGEQTPAGFQVVIEKDLVEKQVIIGIDETKVNHNNLMNWTAERHRKMNYNGDLKSVVYSEALFSLRLQALEHAPAQQMVAGFYNDPSGLEPFQRAIVGMDPVGDFTNQANKIAWSDGSEWHFDKADAGWEAWSAADGGHYFFDGINWVSREEFVISCLNLNFYPVIKNDHEPVGSSDPPSPQNANFFLGDDYAYYRINNQWKRNSISTF